MTTVLPATTDDTSEVRAYTIGCVAATTASPSIPRNALSKITLTEEPATVAAVPKSSVSKKTVKSSVKATRYTVARLPSIVTPTMPGPVVMVPR